MSQKTPLKSRKALNTLQYSPNGKDIASLSPRKFQTNKLDLKTASIFAVDTSHSSKSSSLAKPLKKRASISLPDICSTTSMPNSANKSATSTPHKKKLTTSKSSANGIAHLLKTKKSNISIIVEEKENPNVVLSLSSEKLALLQQQQQQHKENLKVAKEKSLKKAKESKEFVAISVQCNRDVEDMLLSESVEGTVYWKLQAHRRFKAVLETELENKQVKFASPISSKLPLYLTFAL